LKNLVTDKPAPITVKLAQKTDADNLSMLFDSNVTRGALKNLVTDKPAPITVKLAQQSPQDDLDVQINSENPVWNPPFNNWSVNQPSPAHDEGDTGH